MHTTTAKIYENDPQTLAKVIRLVKILNAAQQLTTMLTPTMVSMMSNDERCFVCGQKGLPQQDSSLRNTMAPRQILFKASIYPHLKGQITLHLLWSQTWQTFQQVTVPMLFQPDRSSSFRRHISCSSLSHHSSSHPNCHLCLDTSNWHSHTPSHTCHFSHRHHSCHNSTDWSHSHSSNSHCTAQETQPRKAKPHPRPSNPINPTFPRLTIQDSPSDFSSDSNPLNY